jgi:transposase
LAARDAEVAAIEADLGHWYTHGPFADAVPRLAAYRGVARLGALTIASEVGDWRRFPAARTFMGFTGLVPSEYSSGEAVRRGRITKAGNAHLRTQLVESAWAYQHRASLGVVLRRRQHGVDPGHRGPVLDRPATPVRPLPPTQLPQEQPQRRRCGHRPRTRGFLWAEMTADQPGG